MKLFTAKGISHHVADSDTPNWPVNVYAGSSAQVGAVHFPGSS